MGLQIPSTVAPRELGGDRARVTTKYSQDATDATDSGARWRLAPNRVLSGDMANIRTSHIPPVGSDKRLTVQEMKSSNFSQQAPKRAGETAIHLRSFVLLNLLGPSTQKTKRRYRCRGSRPLVVTNTSTETSPTEPQTQELYLFFTSTQEVATQG